ncbi:MAG TPA: hypothetical protein PKA65_03755 [Solirubrobacterales bacterium]|nr:hypothetical protein [Solirubrobacterales bacterium]
MRGVKQSVNSGGVLWLAALVTCFALLPAAKSEAIPIVKNVQLAGSGGQWKLLVPMTLPLEVSGFEVTGKAGVELPGGQWTKTWQTRVHSGSLREADQRDFFLHVHGIPVSRKLARRILRAGKEASAKVTVRFTGPSADPEIRPDGSLGLSQKGIPRARPGVCETLPRVLLEGSKIRSRTLRFPVCGKDLSWELVQRPLKGDYLSRADVFRYSRRSGQVGADELELAGSFRGRQVTTQRIQFRLGNVPASSVSVAAFGDSVTAGFGYFGATGKPMTLGQLLDCKPGATTLNDACSSNSYNRNSSVGSKPSYLQDFGLSRNISWAAQWANEYGITEYENYAVTGSAPADWLPNGQFHQTLQNIESQNPDYILMTLGANPLLDDVLFDVDTMGCALESDLFGDFRQCVLDAFASVNLDSNMNQIFTDLVQNSSSHVVLMGYPFTIPSSALAYSAAQLEMMESLLNEVIADEAESVSSSRITVVTPPRFNVGIDMEPLYPSNYSCSLLGYKVDGPSVQSTPTQDELEIDHPLSFCSGPSFGKPWVISGDTGIHPSAAGYLQMSSQIPAPGS